MRLQSTRKNMRQRTTHHQCKNNKINRLDCNSVVNLTNYFKFLAFLMVLRTVLIQRILHPIITSLVVIHILLILFKMLVSQQKMHRGKAQCQY